MLVLALDTTTRAGSIALARDSALLAAHVGDARLTHAQRLPGDIVNVLAQHGLTIADVGLYAVAAGPGSFTGLRIGIATIQGLALVQGRPVVPVSALDALACAALGHRSPDAPSFDPQARTLIAAWMDAQRHEVFAALYAVREERRPDASDALPGLEVLEGPTVDTPERTLTRWSAFLHDARRVWFIGEGAVVYAPLVRATLGDRAAIREPVPPVAPVIAELATVRASAGETILPGAIRPLYVRRPDAELARERARRSLAPERSTS